MKRRIEQLNVALEILQREAVAGVAHVDQIDELEQQLVAAQKESEELQTQWDDEKELVDTIVGLHQQMESGRSSSPEENPPAEGDEPSEEPAIEAKKSLTDEELQNLQSDLIDAEAKLAERQGESPLVHPCVNSQAVAETVAAWTGIPVGRMVADEIKTILDLKQLMEASIIGQSHALDRICQSIRTSRANLSDPRTPIGVFLLAGTSGVGKTETAITLAELLYGGEQNMTVINMFGIQRRA